MPSPTPADPRDPRRAPRATPSAGAEARSVVLMGLRASGKSTVARSLAARRGLTAVDLDDRVRACFGGRTVREIWRTDGEPAFRDAETRCLAAVLDEPPAVLALGGGTPMVPAAGATLQRQAEEGRIHLVYLRVGAERLARRMDVDRGDRPPLVHEAAFDGGEKDGEGTAVAEEVAWAIAERDATYRRLATLEVDVDRVLGGDAAIEPPDAADRVAAFIDGALAADA